jgi:hypothetical protein
MSATDLIGRLLINLILFAVCGLMVLQAIKLSTAQSVTGAPGISNTYTDLILSIRGKAFAAGYRCAQIANGYGEPLVDWELDEVRNAVAQGFTSAEKCLRPKP